MKQTTLRLPDDLFDALSAEAVEQERSLNWVITQALLDGTSLVGINARKRMREDPLGKRKHVGPKSSGSPAAKNSPADFKHPLEEEIEAAIVSTVSNLPANDVLGGYSATERSAARQALQESCPHPQARRLGNGQCQVCGAQV